MAWCQACRWAALGRGKGGEGEITFAREGCGVVVDKEGAGFDSLENLQWAEASLVLAAEKGAGVGSVVARIAHVSTCTSRSCRP